MTSVFHSILSAAERAGLLFAEKKIASATLENQILWSRSNKMFSLLF